MRTYRTDEHGRLARDRLSIRKGAGGYVRIGKAKKLFAFCSVRVHSPEGFGDTSASVDIFPSVIQYPAVIENCRAEFTDRAICQLFNVAPVSIHTMQYKRRNRRLNET